MIFGALVNLGDDCPVWEGLYEFCALSAGGSVGKTNIFKFYVIVLRFCYAFLLTFQIMLLIF